MVCRRNNCSSYGPRVCEGCLHEWGQNTTYKAFCINIKDVQEIYRNGTWFGKQVTNNTWSLYVITDDRCIDHSVPITHFTNLIQIDSSLCYYWTLFSNGEDWYRLRSGVQKMMMVPKEVSAYLPGVNEVTDDFIKQINLQLDEATHQVPDFTNLVQKWKLECMS